MTEEKENKLQVFTLCLIPYIYIYVCIEARQGSSCVLESHVPDRLLVLIWVFCMVLCFSIILGNSEATFYSQQLSLLWRIILLPTAFQKKSVAWEKKVYEISLWAFQPWCKMLSVQTVNIPAEALKDNETKLCVSNSYNWQRNLSVLKILTEILQVRKWWTIFT